MSEQVTFCASKSHFSVSLKAPPSPPTARLPVMLAPGTLTTDWPVVMTPPPFLARLPVMLSAPAAASTDALASEMPPPPSVAVLSAIVVDASTFR